jgi:CDP-diacylglycerol--glycerol-3-phosphate 3-phosphatidyltransferase
MTTADKITASRLVLAPLFFIVFFLGSWLPDVSLPILGSLSAWTIPVLWLLFIVIELTDLLDGMVARKQKTGGDFGKLFDPFADTLVWLTFFLCFILDGVLLRIPAAICFLVILYREFSILFLRSLMNRMGHAQGARWGGKIKAFIYMFTGGFALIAVSIQRLTSTTGSAYQLFSYIATAFFLLAVIVSVISFTDYWKIFTKMNQEQRKK